MGFCKVAEEVCKLLINASRAFVGGIFLMTEHSVNKEMIILL